MKCNSQKLRKIKFIIFAMVGILFLGMPTLYATDGVTFVGDDEVETGESQTILIHITYSEKIGILEGVLSYDTENIESFSVSSSYNGWTTTYNESTGKFNALYASGLEDGDVLEITYVLKDEATSGYITLSNISLTTISYSIIDIDDITKTISAKVSSSSNTDEVSNSSTTDDTSSSTTDDTDSDTSGNSSTSDDTDSDASTSSSTDSDTSTSDTSSSSSSSGDSSTSSSSTSGSTTETSSSSSTSDDTTTSSSSLPYTGSKKFIIIGIVIFIILNIFIYRKWRYYKDV